MPLPIHIPLPRIAENVPSQLKEEAMLKMLAADVHLGGKNLNHRCLNHMYPSQPSWCCLLGAASSCHHTHTQLRAGRGRCRAAELVQGGP